MNVSKKKIFLFSCVHFLISILLEGGFFKPIRGNAGSENIAYRFAVTGGSLPDDTLSRWLCWIYAHVFAALFIVILWIWIFGLVEIWKRKLIKRKYLLSLFILFAAGIFAIIVVYPATIVNATDTTWNYVYAKEWLPMYWHGFLTNVIHCACMLVFPHPAAMSVIPFLFGINGICYLMYYVTKESSPVDCVILFFPGGGAILLMPETFRVLSYAGRNYTFALLSAFYIGFFLTDRLHDKEISRAKIIILAFLASLLGTWRSEGILYVLFFPLLLYFTYFYHNKKSQRKQLMQAMIFVLLCYIVLWLPGKYGSDKYQGYDYAIVNTPEPLSVVFACEEANLSYTEAEEDLECVYSVVPREYFEKYGALSQFYYGFDCLRNPRQSGVDEKKGKEYMLAAYRILLHNWDIYLKIQINNYCESIGLRMPFELRKADIENWPENTSEESLQWFEWIWDYFDIGRADIAANYNIVIINENIDALLNTGFTALANGIYQIGWKISGIVKTLVLILTIGVSCMALFRREWVFFWAGLLILGILLAVILTAPTMRENYYYASYFNMYWYLLIAFRFAVKRRIEKQKV